MPCDNETGATTVMDGIHGSRSNHAFKLFNQLEVYPQQVSYL